MKEKIFIDIDNTIAITPEHYFRTYNRMFGTKLPTDQKAYSAMWYHDCTISATGDVEIEKQRLVQIFNTREFWEEIPIFPGAAAAVQKLAQKHDAYLLTAPSFKSPHFFNGRMKWLADKMPFFDYHNIIFCEHKNLFGADSILIDDLPRFLDSFQGRKIKINHNYNINTRADLSFDPENWHTVPALVNQLAKQR